MEPANEFIRGNENRVDSELAFVPAKGALGFQSLPQTVYRVLVQEADVPAVWHNFGRLVVHTRKGLPKVSHEHTTRAGRRKDVPCQPAASL